MRHGNALMAYKIKRIGKLNYNLNRIKMRLVRMRKMRLGGLSVAMACLASVSMTAQSPYGWRGPERDGVYFENGLLKEWPSEGPELLWETMELGKGYSSPVIVDGRLYITGMDEEGTQEIFFAYSLDGKKLYQTAYGVPWTDTYPETRTTPTIENGRLMSSADRARSSAWIRQTARSSGKWTEARSSSV